MIAQAHTTPEGNRMSPLRRGLAAIVIIGASVTLTACSSLFGTSSAPAPGATGAAGETPAASTGPDWLMIGMIAVLAVLVFFMFRNSRKRKADAAKLQDTMRPGAEVMTNFGLFGKIVSIDEVGNTAQLEISKGNVIRVHRQTLVKVVDAVPDGAPRSVEEAMEIANREQEARDAEIERQARELVEDDEPRFGERIEKDDEGGAKG